MEYLIWLPVILLLSTPLLLVLSLSHKPTKDSIYGNQSINTPPNYINQMEEAVSTLTPSKRLKELAKDEHWLVRESVLKNPNVTTSILDILAKDEHWVIREGVANHLSTSEYTREELTKDTHPSVRKAALNF